MKTVSLFFIWWLLYWASPGMNVGKTSALSIDEHLKPFIPKERDLREVSSQHQKILTEAMNAFYEGWRTSEWQPFIAMISKENFTFQFPDGEFKGRRTGDEARQAIENWTKHNTENGNTITKHTITLKMHQDDWLLFCDEATGTFYGKPYASKHAILLKTDGNKITEYREYVGDLTDWK